MEAPRGMPRTRREGTLALRWKLLRNSLLLCLLTGESFNPLAIFSQMFVIGRFFMPRGRLTPDVYCSFYLKHVFGGETHFILFVTLFFIL